MIPPAASVKSPLSSGFRFSVACCRFRPRRHDRSIIFVTEVDVHISLDTFYPTGTAALPDPARDAIIRFDTVSRNPVFHIADIGHIHHIFIPVFVCIDHRRISCRLHLIAECFRNLSESRFSKVHLGRIFHIDHKRIRYKISRRLFDQKLRVFHSLCFIGRFTVYVHADRNPRRIGACHILFKILVHNMLILSGLRIGITVSSTDDRKVIAVLFHRVPVNIHLPLGNVNSFQRIFMRVGILSPITVAGKIIPFSVDLSPGSLRPAAVFILVPPAFCIQFPSGFHTRTRISTDFFIRFFSDGSSGRMIFLFRCIYRKQ